MVQQLQVAALPVMPVVQLLQEAVQLVHQLQVAVVEAAVVQRLQEPTPEVVEASDAAALVPLWQRLNLKLKA